MSGSPVSIVKCDSYNIEEVEKAVRQAVELLGGIEGIIKPNSKVLIKPNLLSARTPEEGVNTHPEVLRAVGRIVKTVTPNIFVGDSPGGWGLGDIDNVYEKTGVKKVCVEEGFKLVKFDKVITLEGFPVASVLKEVDLIISVPKFKTHSTTIITGAVKNMFGMVVGLHKAQCHLRAPMPEEFASVLIDVFRLVRPVLSIMDGIVGMEGDGPAAGPLRNVGLILASRDAVALDAVFSEIIGVEPEGIPLLREAVKARQGIADLDKIDIVGEKLKDARIKDFKLPKTMRLLRLPGSIIRVGIKAIKFYPYINEKQCKRCGLCFKICPKSAIKKVKDGNYRVYRKECIHCLCCHEVCPYKAIALKKSLLAKIVMGR